MASARRPLGTPAAAPAPTAPAGSPVVPSALAAITLTPRTIAADGGLILRPFTEADEPAVAEAMADPGILHWAAGLAVNAAPVADRARLWLLPRVTGWSMGVAPFAVTDAADATLLGYVGLRDVNRAPGQAVGAYWVTPAARGRRVAARALNAAADWAFTPTARNGLGLHRVSIDHAPANEASCHVATAAGFRAEGTTRESFLDPEGRRHDSHLHGRLATDRPGPAGP